MKHGERYRRYIRNMRKWNAFGTWLNYECPECDKKLTFFFDRYDAVCCVYCDNWIDESCGEPDCPFCANRLDTPSEALFYQKECRGMRKEYRRKKYQHKASGARRHQLRKEEHRILMENRH